MLPGGVPQRGQPRAGGVIRPTYNGRQIGSSIVATNFVATDDGLVLTRAGSIPRITNTGLLGWSGNTTNRIVHARTTKSVFLANGGPAIDGPAGFTFVIVFRYQTATASNTTIAAMGAQTGTSGTTLLRVAGGVAAANLYLQVQDGGGVAPYNADITTPVAVNDLRWHTAVVTLDLMSGGSAHCYVDGVAPSAGLAFSGGNFSTNTTFDYVSVCGAIRGGTALAWGPYDVAMFVPIIGPKLSEVEAIDLSRNPWQLVRPVIRHVPVMEISAGGTPFVAELSAPSFSFAGQSITRLNAYQAELSAPEFSIDGQSITRLNAYQAGLSAPEFSIDGQDMTWVTGYQVSLSAPSFAISAQDISRLNNYGVTLSTPEFDFTAQSIDQITGYQASLSAPSFSMVAQDLNRNSEYAADLSAPAFNFTPNSLTYVADGAEGPQGSGRRGMVAVLNNMGLKR